MTRSTLIERLNDALPQTQCTRCGYPDCRSYAEAIAQGQADINQCPPGGAEGVERLSALIGKPARPLNHDNGEESPRQLAVIDEAWCIGCTLCLAACPVDAILGGNKAMHTVLDAQCTGCELCVPVCPVDCISMINASGHATGWNAWSQPQADEARERYAFHAHRLARNPTERAAQRAPIAASTDATKRDAVTAALARARARRTS